jgi:glycosyltransferase A (GT-A) superfamily protein (DUF2064 family)
MNPYFCLLVVAKAPVPGFAKTRLCPAASGFQAADIAAASLLDTLEAALATPGAIPVVAMTGDLANAARSREISRALRAIAVFSQRGRDFSSKLANAHADTSTLHPGLPVVQIGMDTPQVTSEILASAAVTLLRDDCDAVLGPAEDGGWWALGLRNPCHAKAIDGVPMSRADTGELTRRALLSKGLNVGSLVTMSDVDTMADAHRVARLSPLGKFAEAVAAVRRQGSAA